VKAENGEIVQTQLIGAYNTENIAVALCLGKYFGVDASRANAAIAEYVPGNMRSQIVKKESNTIILDAYNANPSSMKAAIDNLAAMKASKKVAILGDMFELEEEADAEHRGVCKLLHEKNFATVYLCGNHFAAVKSELPTANFFTRKEDLIEALKANPIHDSTILVKASRGIGLESVVEFL
ncbi:MAG TPA: cyanophycin synthetase, partial [Cyclobacteriaceae bacterium]